MKKLMGFFFVVLSVFLLANKIYAHPWNVDTYWYHICDSNCGLYWLSYGEYHTHPETKPSSYAKYALAGACIDEKKAIDLVRKELDELERAIINIASDISERYKWSGATQSYVNAMINKEKEALILSYNRNVYLYKTYVKAYNICIEQEWFENYIKLVDKQAKKVKKYLSDVTYSINNTNNVTNKSVVVSTQKAIKNYYKSTTCNVKTSIKKTGVCYCKTWYRLSNAWKSCVKK